MAYNGVLNDIQKCIDLKVPDNIPVFVESEEFDVRIAGMIYEDYCQDADKIFECQKLVIEKFGYDWCWLQIDDCIEFEVLGIGCKGDGNILRGTCEYLPAVPETVKNLRIPDFSKEGRFPVLMEAIGKCKNSICFQEKFYAERVTTKSSYSFRAPQNMEILLRWAPLFK